MIKKTTPSPDVVELRRQAEEKLSKRRKKAMTAPKTKVDTQRLAHELQVNQIELEMQNDELVQSRAELESTLNLYAELYAFAPVGYFTLTRDGTIRRANITGAKLLGLGLSDVVKRRFGVFVSNELRKTFSDFLEKVFTSKDKETCETTLQRERTAPLWVHIEAILDTSRGQNELCYVIVSDITERKLAEEEQKRLSAQDVLTGLFNYSFFMGELARLERGRQFPVSIVVADVDHLKETNDQEGYAAGDALLKRSAQALTAAFRPGDIVARIGGDEFAVLLPATDAATAKILLAGVQQVLQEKNASQTETPIHLSLGMSTSENSMPLPAVLKKAEVNLHRVKRGENAD